MDFFHQLHSLTPPQSDLGLSPTDKPNREPHQHTCLLTPVITKPSFPNKQSTQNLIRPRNQATIQDGRVVVSEFQARQNKGPDNAIDEDLELATGSRLSSSMWLKVFQADDFNAYILVCNEAGPSYDSDVLSEVQDHDHYQDAVCDHHEEHEMHDDVQPNHVVDSHADYTSDSNMTPYDQY
ncbi:hypothetical protein Tco_1399946 [Tanacetum coccineum]